MRSGLDFHDAGVSITAGHKNHGDAELCTVGASPTRARHPVAIDELRIGYASGEDDAALDPGAGERLARTKCRQRFKRTPFAIQVELAGIRTYRVVESEVGKPPTRGGSLTHRHPPTGRHRRQRAGESPGTRS